MSAGFSTFFEDAVRSLTVEPDKYYLSDIENLSNPVEIAIRKFENHPMVQAIKQNISVNKDFYFSNTEVSDILKETTALNNKKNGPFGNIPTKLLKEVVVSKIYERIMQKQILEYIDKHLSPHLCGYRKGYSKQTALISMLEKWKLSIDNKGFAGGVLMDLSKAFDTINHQLLLAKLHAYGFSQQALAIICSYLSNRKQRIKINNVFSSWKDLILGVPQGSVLGPLLFNIYLNDLFFFLKDVGICNFADDTTTYISDESLENVLKSLEKNSMLAIRWFENNYMKLNTDKCRLIVSGYKHEQVWANIGKDLIWESNDVKLLGVTIDRDLKFDKHVLKLCSKANQKLSALSRMANLLSFNKRRTLFKAFVESQFKYCPIVWMFHSRRTNNKINRLHERALRIVYDDDVSTFDQLLAMDKSFCIHHQNIQRLLIEIYKALHDISGNSLK